MSDTIELLFDGDIRGHETGIDCVLSLARGKLWRHDLTSADIDALTAGADREIVDWIVEEFIDTARATIDGKEWHLEWYEGSIFAVREDHDAE